MSQAAEVSKDRKRRHRRGGLSLDSLKGMDTEMLIQALKKEGVITATGSLEKKLSGGEIDGDVLVNMCREGHSVLLSYGFKEAHAFQLDRLYVRLVEEEKERDKKRLKICKFH